MTETITLDRVKEAAARVVAANPDAINPTNDGNGCLYTKLPDDDTPNVAEHCIGGTILLELGFELPEEGRSVKHAPGVDERFTTEAKRYLLTLQRKADNQAPGSSKYYVEVHPHTWSEALELTNAVPVSDLEIY